MKTYSNGLLFLVIIATISMVTGSRAQTFDPLFRVTGIKGECQIKRPDAKEFEPAINGKAYPFGTIVRTSKKKSETEAEILLAENYAVKLFADGEIIVRQPENAATNRLLQLHAGRVQTSFMEGLPPEAVVIETAAAACDSLSGRGEISFRRDKDGMSMETAVASGGMRVTGPQFSVPRIKAGGVLGIFSTEDRSITRLTNLSGDYNIELENGTETPVVFESTTKCTVRIWREHAPIGGRLVVSVFAATASGHGKECFAFAVGRPMVTAGGIPVEATDAASATGGVDAVFAPAITNAATAADALFK